MMDLRHVAAPPWEEDLFAAAHHQGPVEVWSLVRAERIAMFETVRDGGGWRGAVVPGERPLVVAGAWERHGVCGYDLSGERLWQDRSRTNVHTVTALAGGRVAVTYSRRATRVLEAATGQEVRSVRGVLRVVPLTPDVSLGAGGGWCRLLDRSLDPLGPRIGTGLNVVWFAATDGEHLVIGELGGPTRILDQDGRERGRLADHFRLLFHEPVHGTWVGLRGDDDGQDWLTRFADDAEVVDQHRVGPVRDAAVMRGGRALVVLGDADVQVLDCADWTVRPLMAT